jgi:putative addiction module antidote
MNATVKIIQIGNSLGVTLPKEVLAELNSGKGDTLILSKSPDGIRLTAYDPETSRQLEVMREVMKKRRHALRELAK